ncbi:unnamed protein product [Echinostoma caproni]|uniref:Coiled-coil domain-containing protein 52 n=1 Tax=Echinostoma caproni TaxID=27848 RepID=A0A183AD51_9TREM|nr:unnamed protein product [Echinostoma caproni]
MDDSGDILLPPSAFCVTDVTSSNTDRSSPDIYKKMSFGKHSDDLLSSGKMPPWRTNDPDQSQSHQVPVLLSRLSMTETQLRDVENQLRAIREENSQLKHTRDEARLQLQHLRKYYQEQIDNNPEPSEPHKSAKQLQSTTILHSENDELVHQSIEAPRVWTLAMAEAIATRCAPKQLVQALQRPWPSVKTKTE